MGRRRDSSSSESLLLPFRKPFHSGAMLAALAAHAVPGVESTDLEACTHARAMRTPSGPAVVTVTFTEDRVAVTSRPPVAVADWLSTTVRRWFDLDADPEPIDRALGADPRVGPLVAARPGLRVLGHADAFEGAIMTVIGQQVSLAATRTFGGRLVAAYGTRVEDGYAVYPRAETLAAVDPPDLQRAVGLTGARANTVVSVAQAFVSGLRLEATTDPEVARAALLAVNGVGQWTADYLSVRTLGDRDAFVPGDLVLRRALGGKTSTEAAALAEAWRPYRAYALFHLWTEVAYLRSAECASR